MTASALSLAQTPLYEEKFVPALAMIATMRQNIENAIFFMEKQGFRFRPGGACFSAVRARGNSKIHQSHEACHRLWAML